MKRLFVYIVIVFASFLVSCSKFLDIKPTTFVSEALIWEDKALIDQFVANIYGNLLCGFNRKTSGGNWSAAFGGNFDAGTDDFDGKPDAATNQFNTNEITAGNCPFIEELWNSSYTIIRKCNMLIEQLPGVPDNKVLPEIKERYLAEAHFLRAYSYFELIKTFGKVPFIDHVQNLDEDLLVKPTGFGDMVSFICDECDEWYNKLYKEVPANQIGHASQGAFMALKAKALLYWASPLNNPDNDLSRWAAAAEAADAVRKLGIYELYKKGDWPYFNQAFDETTDNKEVIFARRFQFPEMTNCIHMQWSYDPQKSDRGSWNGLYPTQNLADAFETTDGKAITDPTSIYDPQNPYANRDSRFYQCLIYHGMTWEDYPVRMDICTPSSTHARCGYGLRKFIEEHIGPASDLYVGVFAQDNDCPLFRYSEILLNYAEAMNETQPTPGAEVYAAINEIRSRSGQPDLPTGLSREEMRTRIHNERRIELLLEEHRFFDLRRWKRADILREPIRGMTVKQNNDGTFIYTVVEIEKRQFTEDHYYLPIPLSEQEKNPYLAE